MRRCDATADRLSVLDALLSAGADPNAGSMMEGETALEVCAAGLDEGILSFSLPILVYMDNPYR